MPALTKAVAKIKREVRQWWPLPTNLATFILGELYALTASFSIVDSPMIVCSNCLHHNLDEASFCEACGTKLPEMSSCSNCGSPVQKNAHFCGSCGFNLQLSAYQRVDSGDVKKTSSDAVLPPPFPLHPVAELHTPAPPFEPEEDPESSGEAVDHAHEALSSAENDIAAPPPGNDEAIHTQIQSQSAALLHAQSSTLIELPDSKAVMHIGKPNDRVPPDINVSVFSSAEVVSRVHAAIYSEGGNFFVEDVGSANGTYLNNMPLTPSTRYRLRVGDRITLGKGELVTFIFKMN